MVSDVKPSYKAETAIFFPAKSYELGNWNQMIDKMMPQ